jgi:hypothetical protein
MKYIEALRKYNEGKTKWCMPRKGSSDYMIIKKMVDKNYQGKKVVDKKPAKKPAKSSTKSLKHSDVYMSLSKENRNIIDKASKKPKIKKSPNLFMSDKRIQKIQKFFKKYAVKDKYVLENRIKYYEYLLNYIKNIKKEECVKKYIEDNLTKYSIDDKLFLIKKIGTDSVNASIYLTVMKNVLGGNLLAAKITPISNDNFKEINIMDYLTKKVITKGKSKHFLMMYKYFVCYKNDTSDYVSDSKRLIAINELAHGDLKTLVEDRKVAGNSELMYNLFAQTFLSIASFHKLAKNYHNDAHFGNFLYHKNKEVGYYHYVSNKKDYYLKACEYNIMIYDFGYSEDIKEKNAKHNLIDYLRIINAFMNKYHGWGEYVDLPEQSFNNEMIHVQDHLMSYIRNISSSYDLDIVEFIYNIMQKGPKNMHNNIFTTTKPNKIINKIPFVI